jgi:DNA repair photolyase
VLLARELGAAGYECRTMALGTNTDPYQPIERGHRITRAILEVLEEHDHPVGIVTKSDLILRDLDLLARMAAKRLAKVAISVTTLDRELARKMEPRAPTPAKRLDAIRALSAAGVPVSLLAAPIIPALTDHEIERIIDAAAAAGARHAGYVLLRLPLEISDIFQDWLCRVAPDRAGRVMSLMRGARGGKDYQSEWGLRMRGDGPYAWTIARRFQLAAKRAGLDRERIALRTDLFRTPRQGGRQLSLFDGP